MLSFEKVKEYAKSKNMIVEKHGKVYLLWKIPDDGVETECKNLKEVIENIESEQELYVVKKLIPKEFRLSKVEMQNLISHVRYYHLDNEIDAFYSDNEMCHRLFSIVKPDNIDSDDLDTMLKYARENMPKKLFVNLT